MVEGVCTVTMIDEPEEIERCQSPMGKPFLRLTMSDGLEIDITTNLAEMIGGAGTGCRLRYEDKLKGAN